MNNRYTINLTVDQLAVICRSLRDFKEGLLKVAPLNETHAREIKRDYELAKALLKDIDPNYRLF